MHQVVCICAALLSGDSVSEKKFLTLLIPFFVPLAESELIRPHLNASLS